MESQPQLPQDGALLKTFSPNEPLPPSSLQQPILDPKSFITKNDKRFKTKVSIISSISNPTLSLSYIYIYIYLLRT